MDDKGAFTLTADCASDGMRLDQYLASELKDLTRSHIAGVIKKGHIRVCGQFKKPGYRLKPGDTVSISLPAATPSEYTPEPIDIHIVYEDRHIIVVDKPAGLVVHPAPGHPGGTLVNALLYHCPDISGIGGEIRPGIVHRLDKDTSGLMVAAKNEVALNELARQFKSREVKKIYLALTHGQWKTDTGEIRLPIGRHPTDRKKMSVHSRKSRTAITRWQVQARFERLSLVRADLKTGRTHQIRVHFAAAGHPIAGDPVYASPKLLKVYPDDIKARLASINRQLLHAHFLHFLHPKTQKAISFESEIPDDMAQIVDYLADRQPQ